MPDLLEQMYSSQQINIPPNLPYILKQYAKAAIRTQPYDLLLWSAAYFRAKVNNIPPPVKERLEYPPIDTPSRLSPGFLKVLHKQLGSNEVVQTDQLYEKWLGVCLVKEALDAMIVIGHFKLQIPWLKFVAIAAGHLCMSLSKTMVMICEILTEEPEGGSAMVPVQVFVNLYQFLAQLDCGPPHIDTSPSDDLQGSEIESAHSEIPYLPSKYEPAPKEVLVREADSNAGLMVWEDVQPDEVPDVVHSPKASSELGADSEAGLEVLGDAKSAASEVLTLYSAQTQQKSNYSIHPTVSKVTQKSIQSTPTTISKSAPRPWPISETILSHSSLKENDDWIKLDTVKVDEDLNAEDVTSSGVEQTSPSTPNVSEQEITSQEIPVETKSEGSGLVADAEVEESIKSKLDDVISEGKVEEDLPKALSEKSIKQKASDKISGDDKDQHVEFELQDTSMQSQGVRSEHEDLIFPLDESVTVQNFVEEHEVSMVSYSTVEIRKGIFGENSEDKIDRASSENTVKAAETVHNIELTTVSSSKFTAEEQSSHVQIDEISQDATDVVTTPSRSFIVLPPEINRSHVPGIGPVIPEAQVLAVVEYMQYWAGKQEGMVMPRNINHLLCPPLDLPEGVSM